jgi:hypothetical protein
VEHRGAHHLLPVKGPEMPAVADGRLDGAQPAGLEAAVDRAERLAGQVKLGPDVAIGR